MWLTCFLFFLSQSSMICLVPVGISDLSMMNVMSCFSFSSLNERWIDTATLSQQWLLRGSHGGALSGRIIWGWHSQSAPLQLGSLPPPFFPFYSTRQCRLLQNQRYGRYPRWTLQNLIYWLYRMYSNVLNLYRWTRLWSSPSYWRQYGTDCFLPTWPSRWWRRITLRRSTCRSFSSFFIISPHNGSHLAR